MQSDCLKCHVVPRFQVKEAVPDAVLSYPVDMKILVEGSRSIGYFLVDSIESSRIEKFFLYLDQHEIKYAVLEIHSPGGFLFEAQRIIGIIQYWQARGFTVETRIFGIAFSAGFYVFTAGDIRLVSPDADLMWHELYTMEGFGFKISTPSDREEAARVLRHLQDIRNRYLASRSKISKEEIDARISKKEWWMSGTDAVKYGFATGLLGEAK